MEERAKNTHIHTHKGIIKTLSSDTHLFASNTHTYPPTHTHTEMYRKKRAKPQGGVGQEDAADTDTDTHTQTQEEVVWLGVCEREVKEEEEEGGGEEWGYSSRIGGRPVSVCVCVRVCMCAFAKGGGL